MAGERLSESDVEKTHLHLKRKNITSRIHDVKIVRGTLSGAIGLKLAASEVSTILCASMVHAFAIQQGLPLSPNCIKYSCNV